MIQRQQQQVCVCEMRRDAVWSVGDALSRAWRHAYAVGYEPRLATSHEMLKRWHFRSGERVVVPVGKPLALALSRGVGTRPLLLISGEAIDRYHRDLASAQRLAAVIERIAAYTPTGHFSGYALACEVGVEVRWSYAVNAADLPTIQSA